MAEDRSKIYDKYRPFLEERKCDLCGGDRFRALRTQEKYGFPIGVVLCKRCGLVFYNPMWTEEGYNEFYRKDYRHLTRTFDKDNLEEQGKFSRYLVTFLSDIVKKSSTLRILEIGCDQGGILSILKESFGGEVYGIEPNEKACEVARKKGIEVSNKNFEAGDYPKEFFDLVIITKTLNHLVQPSRTLWETNRILKPTGKLYIDAKDVVRGSSMTHFYAQIDHPFMYGEHTLKILFKKNNFEVIKVDRVKEKSGYDIRIVGEKQVLSADTRFRAKKKNYFQTIGRLYANDVISCFVK